MIVDHKALIEEYVTGWRENNLSKILNTLTQDSLIIESHGPRYKGKRNVEKWIETWKRAGNKVTKWKIKSFYYLENSHAAFFEWDFECVVGGEKHKLAGISVVKFKDGKIAYVREYRTKNED
jgi:ketosteroid isomerase-like protein